jgi:hypothetical protein
MDACLTNLVFTAGLIFSFNLSHATTRMLLRWLQLHASLALTRARAQLLPHLDLIITTWRRVMLPIFKGTNQIIPRLLILTWLFDSQKKALTWLFFSFSLLRTDYGVVVHTRATETPPPSTAIGLFDCTLVVLLTGSIHWFQYIYESTSHKTPHVHIYCKYIYSPWIARLCYLARFLFLPSGAQTCYTYD